MNKRKCLVVILILLFLQGIFANIHHPIMPSYVSKLNLPNYMFGFFFAFMNIGMLIGAPFWGSLGDSGKKRISVITGFTMYGVFQLLFGLGNFFGPWTLSLIRFFSGFGIAASFSIIISEIILLSDKENRAQNIAFGAAALAIGGAIGQFLGGFVYTNEFLNNTFNTDSVFVILFIQFVSSMILALYTFLLYRPVEVERDENVKRAKFYDGFKEIKNISVDLLLFLIALTFITIGAVNIDKYLDVYFINDLGYKENILGNFKMVVGFVSVFTSLLIVPLFMKFKKRLLLLSVFQIISSMLILIIFGTSFTSFIALMYTFYMVYIVIKTTNEPLEKEYISNYGTEENMSTLTGIRHSFYSLGTIIGPILGAFIYDYNSVLVFYVSIIFFLISIVLIGVSAVLKKKNNIELIKEKPEA